MVKLKHTFVRRWFGTAALLLMTGGANAAATFSSCALSGPVSIPESGAATFSAIETYSDGSTASITPTWRVCDGFTLACNANYSTVASISASGVVSAGAVAADTTITVTALCNNGNYSASKTVTIQDSGGFKSCAVNGPSSVPAGTSATYTATETRLDGSSSAITPVWRVCDGFTLACNANHSTVAAIGTDGVLTAFNVAADATATVTALCNNGNYSASKSIAIAKSGGVPLTGNPDTPLAPPVVEQSVYRVTNGSLPASAISVSATGTLGAATISATLDLAAVQGSMNMLSSGYNIYLAALVPGRQLPGMIDSWFLNAGSLGWQTLVFPLSSFMENVAVGSVSERRVISILVNTDITRLIGAEVYLGYGLSDQEMLAARRYRGIYTIKLE